MTLSEQAVLVYALIKMAANRHGYKLRDTEQIAVFAKAYDFLRARSEIA